MPYADKAKQAEYQRRWHAKRREDYFANKCCVECGSTETLELDHIDPSAKVDHKIWSWSERRRLEEIVKCQVLCNDCHKKKTYKQIAKEVHGTRTMYMEHGCRCEPCTRVASEARQRQRAAPRPGVG